LKPGDSRIPKAGAALTNLTAIVVKNRLNRRSTESGTNLVLQVDAVGLRYGNGPEVLKDVSFSLAPGQFAFLTGASGAGKTSLLRLLFMALKPTRGRIELFGKDVVGAKRKSLPALRRRMGVVFQDFRLLDHLSTFDNVALPLRITGQRPEHYASDVKTLLTWVGLGDKLDAMPPVLSGGEKQRAAIARAVISKPEILLADEPTGNVDPALAKRLLHLFAQLNKQGTTVLLATHDEALIRQVKAPVLHLEAGRLHSA
jgi:cell division transport system ATP-binding protein